MALDGSAKKVLVAGGLILMVAVLYWVTRSPKPELPSVTFVDEVTLEEVAVPAGSIAPMPGPKGNVLVEGVFVQNADGTRRLVYLQKYDEAGRIAAEKRAKGIPLDAGEGAIEPLVRAASGGGWHRVGSAEGEKIVASGVR